MNITKAMLVSGLLLFLFGLSVGPYMVSVQSPMLQPAHVAQAESLSKLREAIDMGGADEVAAAAGDAVLKGVARDRSDGARRGSKVAHAHANLESLWTVAAALILLHLSVPLWLRNSIGGCFIVGSWCHGGAFVAGMYGLTVVYKITELGVGPILLIAGAALLLFGVLTGYRTGDHAEA